MYMNSNRLKSQKKHYVKYKIKNRVYLMPHNVLIIKKKVVQPPQFSSQRGREMLRAFRENNGNLNTDSCMITGQTPSGDEEHESGHWMDPLVKQFSQLWFPKSRVNAEPQFYLQLQREPSHWKILNASGFVIYIQENLELSMILLYASFSNVLFLAFRMADCI